MDWNLFWGIAFFVAVTFGAVVFQSHNLEHINLENAHHNYMEQCVTQTSELEGCEKKWSDFSNNQLHEHKVEDNDHLPESKYSHEIIQTSMFAQKLKEHFVSICIVDSVGKGYSDSNRISLYCDKEWNSFIDVYNSKKYEPWQESY
jgi:hypothetical protein